MSKQSMFESLFNTLTVAQQVFDDTLEQIVDSDFVYTRKELEDIYSARAALNTALNYVSSLI